jgi:predicted RNA-binding Zn-ribbon protein involved in translation (DUF1610 family)
VEDEVPVYMETVLDLTFTPSRAYDPFKCPECGEVAVRTCQGHWGTRNEGWSLFEGFCANKHYWCYDHNTQKPLLPIGYRMRRDGSRDSDVIKEHGGYEAAPRNGVKIGIFQPVKPARSR